MASKMTILAAIPILFILFQYLAVAKAAGPTFNVQRFGSRPDGRSDSTRAFLDAWTAACNSAQPSTMYVPPGRYLLGQATFAGDKCRSWITVRIDGILVAPSSYNVIGSAGNWIKFIRVDGLTINGGTLDGQGTGLWNCKKYGGNCPQGSTSFGIYNSNNVMVNGLRSLNSQMFHMIVYGSHVVKLQGITISAPGNSPNTDGIHVQNSSGVTIMNSLISTGDDCISIGPGTSNLWIQGINCGPGHGISIGSLGSQPQEQGVQNVTVRSVVFRGTTNGVRIKTWAKPSTGFVQGVLFQHITMVNVENPVLIDQNYCPSGRCSTGQASGVRISDVRYEDIHGTSASEVAVTFDCSKRYPCHGLSLQNVNLKFRNQRAMSSCVNAAGTAFGFVAPTSCLF